MRVLVVGGGTAGLVSALILKKFLNITVDLVCSKNIGIIGVGEGSTEHFNDFMQFVGIDQHSILKECDATFKSGIMFEGWGKTNYLHSVTPPFNGAVGQYNYIYGSQIAKNSSYLTPSYYWDNKIDMWYLNKNAEPPINQYHFNTYKLNEFLIKFAKSIGIKIIDDEIKDVQFKPTGDIDYIVGDKSIYHYNFYIDSTGFNKLLIGKMGSKWVSFSKYLKMKSAVVFPSPDEDEYNLWTLSKAMNYGWRFKIPTWGRHGNGYIFDSDYATLDQIKKEIDLEFGRDVEITKQFNFDPGYIENPWIKNCVAIGLSSSFVEPLEATSIGSAIQQSFLLMHKIKNYSEKEINSYNKSFKLIMENIRDFIALHYITKKSSTEFWLDIQNIELPDSLKYNLDIWKHNLPIKEDFTGNSDYAMFWPANYILIMNGLNIFDNFSIKCEYEKLNQNDKKSAENIILNAIMVEKNMKKISHKKYIQLIRENF